jgi:transposase InsO family protein
LDVKCRKRPQIFSISSINDPTNQLGIIESSKSGTISTRCYVHVIFGDDTQTVSLLFDTGAAASIISGRTFERLKTNGALVEKLDATVALSNASGSRMRTAGAYNIRLRLQDTTIVAPFIVCLDLPHAGILGMNVMRANGIILDPISGRLFTLTPQQRQKLRLQDSGFDTSIAAVNYTGVAATTARTQDDKNNDCWTVATHREYKIEPKSARLIRCKLRDKDGAPVAETEAIATIASLEVAFETDEHGTFNIYMPNVRTDDAIIPRGTVISTARPIEEATPRTQMQAETELCARLDAVTATKPQNNQPVDPALIRKAIAETASTQARDFYTRLLSESRDVISTDQHDLGRSDALKHEVELSDDTPVYTQQYRLPLEQIQLVKDHLHAWLKSGIVEKARSKYNSPVFCVPKKDSNKLRVVLDYRKLNAKCMPDKYSIRPVDQCIEEIGHAQSKFFSCIDLRSGFWQLPLEDKSRHLTAFTIPGVGQFQYTVAPMGLAGSPASFSRLMDFIMRGLSFVITYIDDCLVHSRTEREHAEHVRTTLQRLRQHGLKINLEKCTFGAAQIQYLGHTISGDGITPGKDKTAAVADAEPPRTIRQVRSFMGLANYFRQFIPRFATVAAPLFALTRDKSGWKSGKLPHDAAAAFYKLKAAITSEPVLRYHSPTGKYHLYADAAQGDADNLGGLGAVLMQEDEKGEKHAVGYASRRLQSHECNYPAFLLELQAAVFAMEYFDTHLRGRQFYLYSDHKPLCKLSTVHTKTLNRLQMKMLEMYPQIRHVSGGENSVADFLSRYQGIAAAQIDASPFRINALQDRDPGLVTLKEKCKADPSFDGKSNSAYVTVGKAKFTMRDDILYYVHGKPEQGRLKEPDLRICAPLAMQKELLVEAHNSALTGHQGAYKSLARIQGHFFWPQMDAHMREHVAQCKTCMATTDKGTKDPPRQQQLDIPQGPNWRVHADLFGPQKCADGKKRFVLVMTDAFTKTVALRVIDDKAATTVARGMLETWCYVYGIPKMIVTDQGLEFTNELARHIWKALQIKHTTTTPYHPQCNSSAEVFNRTMKRYLAAAIRDAEKSTLDWPLYIAPLMFAYNTSIHKAAKESPFMTTFGYDPRLPLWDDQGERDARTIHKDDHADRYFAHKKAQSDTRKIVMNNLQHDRERRAALTHKNIKSSEHEYAAGDLVWVKISQSSEPNKKLAATWEPGTIIQRTGFSTYKVRRDDRSRKKTATLNATKLKPRVPDDDDEDGESDEDTDAETTDDDETPNPDDEEADADNIAITAAVHIDGDKVIFDNLVPDDVVYLLKNGYTLTSHGGATRAGGAHSAPPAPAHSAIQQADTNSRRMRAGRGPKKSPITAAMAKKAQQAKLMFDKLKGKKSRPATSTTTTTTSWPPSTTGPPAAPAFSPPTSNGSLGARPKSKLPHQKAVQKLADFLSSGAKDTAPAQHGLQEADRRERRPRPPPGAYRE